MPFSPHLYPAAKPPAGLRELPDDIDALDAELGALAGRTLVRGVTHYWVSPLTKVGTKDPVPAEFTLVGHVRLPDSLILEVVERVGGARGMLEVEVPQRPPWRVLHEVLPTPDRAGAARAQDAEESARRRRDDMLRRVFS